jgi:bifunctional DNase/RNase
MKKIKLEIAGLSYSQTQTGAYALVLSESEGKRRLPIIIGGFEAQAIAIELEKMTPSRPLTHDLFKTFADTFNISVTEVIIYNLVEGIFYAKLVCDDGTKEAEIDARTSDAIAIAVRFGCPIYTYEFILSTAGIVLDEDSPKEIMPEPEEEQEDKPEIFSLSIKELEEKLQKAISEEDYEKASQIRDEIKKRKKQ